LPESLKRFVVNAVIDQFPNFAVREFRTHSLPHKVDSIAIEGMAEQRPNPDSRITLSDKTDALGMPMARVDWRGDRDARRSLARLGQHLMKESIRIDIPAPQLDDWVIDERHDDGIFIDSAHTAGTTRMSDDPKQGVVDSNCRVHGVAGLYVAGASVFPTSGHANPTLMIVSLAIRLADRIKLDLKR
jgi:choline dehydrogenase-like flavoprotein